MQKKSKQVWKIVHLVHLSRVHAAKVMLMNSQQKQQKPTCSFSGASISGCTINVYQGATVVQQPNIADDKIDIKLLTLSICS